MNTVALRLKKLRRDEDLTQKGFAEAIAEVATDTGLLTLRDVYV